MDTIDNLISIIGSDEFEKRIKFILNREFDTDDIVCNLINLSKKRKLKRRYYNDFLADVRLLYKIKKYKFKWQCPKKQREIWAWCKNKCYRPTIFTPKLKKNPGYILNMKNPTREDWKIALWNDTSLVKFVNDYSLQELSIIKDDKCVQYIDNLAEDLGMLAILFDYKTIEKIKNPTENQENLAVMINSDAFYYIKQPKLTTQLLAIAKFNDIFYDIKNPSQEVKDLFKELYPCAYEVYYRN